MRTEASAAAAELELVLRVAPEEHCTEEAEATAVKEAKKAETVHEAAPENGAEKEALAEMVDGTTRACARRPDAQTSERHEGDLPHPQHEDLEEVRVAVTDDIMPQARMYCGASTHTCAGPTLAGGNCESLRFTGICALHRTPHQEDGIYCGADKVEFMRAEFGAVLPGATVWDNVSNCAILCAETQTRTQINARLVWAVPETAHTALENDLRGAIAVVKRGDCSFVEKAVRVGEAGAVAMMVINTEDSLISPGQGNATSATRQERRPTSSAWFGMVNSSPTRHQRAGTAQECSKVYSQASRNPLADSARESPGHGVVIPVVGVRSSDLPALAAWEGKNTVSLFFGVETNPVFVPKSKERLTPCQSWSALPLHKKRALVAGAALVGCTAGTGLAGGTLAQNVILAVIMALVYTAVFFALVLFAVLNPFSYFLFVCLKALFV